MKELTRDPNYYNRARLRNLRPLKPKPIQPPVKKKRKVKTKAEKLAILEMKKGLKRIFNRVKKKHNTKKWKAYRELVWKATKEQPLHLLENYTKRGFNNYHLDHKISVWYGWENNLNPIAVADISNLRFVPRSENMIKGKKALGQMNIFMPNNGY